jgi:hypothetical protein
MHGMASRMIVAALLLVAAPALAAAPRLTIGPVQGDPKLVIPTQLAEQLCGTWDCVLWKEVSTRQQPDLAKAGRLGVAGLLTGAVTGAAGARKLNLSLLTTSTRPARTWSFPLTAAGRLPGSATRQLDQDLNALLRPPAAAAAPAPVRPPEPVAAAAAPPPPPAAAPSPAVAPPPPAAAAPAPAAKSAAPVERRWLVAAELGLFVSQRQLSYSGVSASTGTLLGFDAGGLAGPCLSLEVQPLARSGSAALGGLGLRFGLAMSVGLETESLAGEKLPTQFTRLEVGARWRAPPIGGLALVLIPEVAWVSQKLTVDPAIPGLPDSDLSGVRVGLSAEARVASRVTILAGLGWVKWTTARELIDGDPAYFPGSSATGLEAEVGVGVAVWGPLSVRVLGTYASTSYTLDPDPTGTYAATGAEDRYLGMRAVLRGEF